MNWNNMIHGYFSASRNVLDAGWPNKMCKGNALKGTLAGLLIMASAMVSSGQALLATTHSPINGTITQIDVPMLYLHMRTDDGRLVDLAVANVDAIRAVRRGDHIRADVDDHGIVLNINKTLSPPRRISYSRG
jgi:hypothetical protein